MLKPSMHSPRRLAPLGIAALLLILTLLFWKFRIFDRGVNPRIDGGNVDLHIQVTPMNTYGFEALRHGHVPLWNPYQFCGEPFLAIPYVGLFYPPHLVNLYFDVLTSFEICFVLHMFFGALSTWLLARHFGISDLGALCAAVTFVWSGNLISSNTLPGVFETLTWMPLTVLLFDLVLEGRRWAWLGLIVALASQVLIGVPEFLLHTLYAGAVFVMCRVVQMGWYGRWRAAVRGIAVIAGAGLAAVLLAMPQLLPALELTQQSARAAGTVSFTQASLFAIPPLAFLKNAIKATPVVSVGVLPLIGLAFILGAREQRMAAIAALIAGTVAALLAFGGPLYRLYYAIPVLGSIFRRPIKFLDIYSFAQAIVVGIAVTRLQSWAAVPRRTLCLQPSWWIALLLGGAAAGWLASLGQAVVYWEMMLALLVAFAIVPFPAWRIGMLAGLCVVQGANLFFNMGDAHMRPVKRPEMFVAYSQLLDRLQRDLGDARVYLSSQYVWVSSLTMKQGLLRHMAVSTDYEPLAVGRYATFFDTVTPRDTTAFGGTPFFGVYDLKADSRWRLMDLTGTKFFVMQRGEAGDTFMIEHPSDFRVISDLGIRVFERRNVLPRAYFVPRARVVASDAVLQALDSPDFDPRVEVLLDELDGEPVQPPPGVVPTGTVRITSYEPERVEIAADASAPGYLVLSDLHYPGWRAFIAGREVPIRRADYLFRAVHLEAGHSVVRFEYEPGSFRIGLWLAGATSAVLAGIIIWTRPPGKRTKRGEPRA